MTFSRRGTRGFCGGLVILLLTAVPSWAQPPLIFQPVATDRNSVTNVVGAGDGSGRLFIVQQNGLILIHNGQQVLGTPFLDISALTLHSGERGLLGLAFAPDYASSGYFYVHYTDRDDPNFPGENRFNSVVARYRVS